MRHAMTVLALYFHVFSVGNRCCKLLANVLLNEQFSG